MDELPIGLLYTLLLGLVDELPIGLLYALLLGLVDELLIGLADKLPLGLVEVLFQLGLGNSKRYRISFYYMHRFFFVIYCFIRVLLLYSVSR